MGQLNYPAQASPVWGDQSGRGQDAIDLIENRAWVLATKLNHSTRGEMMIGFWPTTTLNSSPNCALYTASNFLRARVGADTCGREVDYSAAADYPIAVVWTPTGYQVFSKRGDDWFRDWHVRQADVQNYAGFSNYDAVGSLQDSWIIQSHKADLFAFDIEVDSPVVGEGSGQHNELPPYEFYMEFDYVTEPTSGQIVIGFNYFDADGDPENYAVIIDSSSLLTYNVYASGAYTPLDNFPDPSPTITPGSTIRVFIDWDGVRFFENEAEVFMMYNTAGGYDLSNGTSLGANRDWTIEDLGTGGVIENLRIGKRRLRNESGELGADVVTNGDFDTDTDWTKDAQWTIGGGEAICTADNINSADLKESGATQLVEGTLYQIDIDVPSASVIGSGFSQGIACLFDVDSPTNGAFNAVVMNAVDSFQGINWARETPMITVRGLKNFDANIDNLVIRAILFVPDNLGTILNSILGL